MKTAILLLFFASLGLHAESLLPNGDFSEPDPADPAKPKFWDKPDGLGVVWADAPGGAGAPTGRAIKLDTSVSEKALVGQWERQGITKWSIPQPAASPVALTYGLSFYSEAVPVTPGKAYRVSFDYRGKGKAMVWVRGYGTVHGEARRRYEAVVHCPDSATGWTHCEQVIHPTRNRPDVTEVRVMLFAAHPPGQYWFANVQLEELP